MCFRFCVPWLNSPNLPPSTIYFNVLYPQEVLVRGKPHSPTLLTCCLLSFGCCFVIALPCSYIPSYPLNVFLSIIATGANLPCITTEKQYFFTNISISGWERNLNVPNFYCVRRVYDLSPMV